MHDPFLFVVRTGTPNAWPLGLRVAACGWRAPTTNLPLLADHRRHVMFPAIGRVIPGWSTAHLALVARITIPTAAAVVLSRTFLSAARGIKRRRRDRAVACAGLRKSTHHVFGVG